MKPLEEHKGKHKFLRIQKAMIIRKWIKTISKIKTFAYQKKL